jgi:hypothetical protein
VRLLGSLSEWHGHSAAIHLSWITFLESEVETLAALKPFELGKFFVEKGRADQPVGLLSRPRAQASQETTRSHRRLPREATQFLGRSHAKWG